MSGVICLLILVFYQDVIVLLNPTLIKVPGMDHQTMMSDASAMANYMNFSIQDARNLSTAPIVFRRIIGLYPKLRYKVVRLGGDLFYTMMSEEETIQKALIYVPSEEKMLRS